MGPGIQRDKRVVHMEVDDRTWVNADGLQAGLTGLAQHANDACNFEDILQKAIIAIYSLLPEGMENYGGKKPKLGNIWFNRLNARKDGHGVVEWSPSESWKENMHIQYVQMHVAKINLGEKTYTTPWGNNYDERYHSIPEILMRDTEVVMDRLGLEKVVD